MAEKSPGSPSRMKKLEHLIQACQKRLAQRQVSNSSSAAVGEMSRICRKCKAWQEHQVHQHHPFGVPSEA